MRSAVRVHVFPDSVRFGRQLARAAGFGCAGVTVHRFPDGESLVRIRPPAGRHAILVRSLHDPNAKLVEILLPAAARAVIVDDIASSGGTLVEAARALRRGGLRKIDALVVHPLLAPGAEARIRAAGVRRLLSCDTIPHRTNAIAVAPLLAEALG